MSHSQTRSEAAAVARLKALVQACGGDPSTLDRMLSEATAAASPAQPRPQPATGTPAHHPGQVAQAIVTRAALTPRYHRHQEEQVEEEIQTTPPQPSHPLLRRLDPPPPARAAASPATSDAAECSVPILAEPSEDTDGRGGEAVAASQHSPASRPQRKRSKPGEWWKGETRQACEADARFVPRDPPNVRHPKRRLSSSATATADSATVTAIATAPTASEGTSPSPRRPRRRAVVDPPEAAAPCAARVGTAAAASLASPADPAPSPAKRGAPHGRPEGTASGPDAASPQRSFGQSPPFSPPRGGRKPRLRADVAEKVLWAFGYGAVEGAVAGDFQGITAGLVPGLVLFDVTRALERFKPMPGGDAAERVLATCLVNLCLKYGYHHLVSGVCARHHLGAEFFPRVLPFFADDGEALAYVRTLCADNKDWQQAYAEGLYSDRYL